MPPRADPVSDLDKAARLVAKAVGTLPKREHDEVLRFLIREWMGRGLGYQAQPPGALARSAGEVLGVPSLSPMAVGTRVAGGAAVQMLPVRLPRDLYERLKTWADEHGFSMATVVRGLVERFLDAQ